MRLRGFPALLAIVCGASAFAAPTVEDHCLRDADESLFGLKTWSELHRWYHDFSDCDDGYLGDGVSEFVTASLAKRWREFGSLRDETGSDGLFKGFVFRHIDASADAENLKGVVFNATKRCPRDAAALCSALAANARKALHEIDLIHKGLIDRRLPPGRTTTHP